MSKRDPKKAYLVDVTLTVRVTIPDHMDPDIDPEFNEAVLQKVRERIQHEGLSGIAENITDWWEDEEVPWTPEE